MGLKNHRVVVTANMNKRTMAEYKQREKARERDRNKNAKKENKYYE